jgi:hypothetical protein
MPNLSSEQLEAGLRLLLSLYAQYLGSTNNPTLQRHLLEQMAEVLAGWDLSPERLRRILPTEILSALDTAALIPPRRRRPPRKSIVMGSGSVLIGSRSQAATSIQAVRPDSISQTGTTTCLCRHTFIVFQQAAQPFPTAHLFLFSRDC